MKAVIYYLVLNNIDKIEAEVKKTTACLEIAEAGGRRVSRNFECSNVISLFPS